MPNEWPGVRRSEVQEMKRISTNAITKELNRLCITYDGVTASYYSGGGTSIINWGDNCKIIRHKGKFSNEFCIKGEIVKTAPDTMLKDVQQVHDTLLWQQKTISPAT